MAYRGDPVVIKLSDGQFRVGIVTEARDGYIVRYGARPGCHSAEGVELWSDSQAIYDMVALRDALLTGRIRIFASLGAVYAFLRQFQRQGLTRSEIRAIRWQHAEPDDAVEQGVEECVCEG